MCKRFARLVVSMLIMLAGVASPAVATLPAASLPPEIQALGNDWQLQGNARFRKYLVNVYDGRLWTAAGRYDPQGLYALDLTYALAFKAKDLADRSVQEMRRIGAVDADRLTSWGAVMRRAFPEIKAGDRLIGVNLPGRETRFYLNGKLFSTVSDPAFGPAFFGIWLDPRTSEPAFRRELLKQANT
jgi:hypothetical protein